MHKNVLSRKVMLEIVCTYWSQENLNAPRSLLVTLNQPNSRFISQEKVLVNLLFYTMLLVLPQSLLQLLTFVGNLIEEPSTILSRTQLKKEERSMTISSNQFLSLKVLILMKDRNLVMLLKNTNIKLVTISFVKEKKEIAFSLSKKELLMQPNLSMARLQLKSRITKEVTTLEKEPFLLKI